MIGDAMLASSEGGDSDRPWFSWFFYWTCGPHRTRGLAFSREERSDQIAAHMSD